MRNELSRMKANVDIAKEKVSGNVRVFPVPKLRDTLRGYQTIVAMNKYETDNVEIIKQKNVALYDKIKNEIDSVWKAGYNSFINKSKK
jgi:hypothetical protein